MGVQFAGNILVQSNGGPLPIANGGTGQTSASAAITALLPSQAGNSGKALVTNGTVAAWQNLSGTPGGSDTAIQYNDSGSFGGNSFLTINKSTGAVTSTSTLLNQGLYISKAVSDRDFTYQTSGSDRWILRANSTSESGSNAGSNLQLLRIADNGATQNTVFTASRATGVVDFAVAPTVAGSPISGTPTLASTQVGFGSGSNLLTGSTKLTFTDSTATLKVSEDGGSVSGVITSGGGLSLSLYPSTYIGNTPGADLNLFGGQSSRRGGNVVITAGQENTSGYGGGDVNISGGAGFSGTGYAGHVYISGGVGTASQGVVIFKTTNTERFRITGNGAWSVGSAGTDTGTAGQILTSNGSGSAPTWQAGGSAAGTLTGTTLASNVVTSSLTSVGTLSSLAVTGTTTQTGALNLAGASSPLQVGGSAGTSGQVLTSAGTGATPTWTTPSSGSSLTATQVGFGNGSNVLSGTTTFTFDSTTRTVSVGNATSGTIQNGTGGGNLVIQTADATTAGTVTMSPGNSTSSTAASMTLRGGAVSGTSGTAGNIFIQGGQATAGTGSNAGDAYLRGGTASTGTGANAGGDAIVEGGGASTSGGGSGDAIIRGGTGGAGSTGGLISMHTGTSTTLVERFRISNAGGFGLSGANFGTSGQVLTSAGNAPPTWTTLAISSLANATTLGTTTNSATSITGISGTTASSSPMTISASATSSGTGNSLTLLGGAGATTGGAILVSGAAGGGANNGGAATLRGGDTAAAGGTAGAVTIHADSSLGAGGAVIVRGGDAGGNGATGPGGNITIRGGNSTNGATSGTGGNVTIASGTTVTVGVPGDVIIQSPAGAGSALTTRVTVKGSTGAMQFNTGWADTANTTFSATLSINCALVNSYRATLTANTTSFAFTNVPASGLVYTVTLFLTQDGTGSRTMTWPTGTKWQGGAAPVLTTTAGKTDIITLTTPDGGTNWYGAVVGLNY